MRCSIFLLSFVLSAINVCSQSLSPVVIPCSGAYKEVQGISLSSTLGEPAYITLNNSTTSLTQGEQQPYYLFRLLNVKAFIEGYYLGSGQMSPVLFNNDPAHHLSSHCDSVLVELRQSTSPYEVLHARKVILMSNGDLQLQVPSSLPAGYYYVVLKTRNAIETWSKQTVLFSSANTSFQFTTP